MEFFCVGVVVCLYVVVVCVIVFVGVCSCSIC